MDDISTVFITAVTTLLIAVVAAILTSRLQASREQSNWLRERRHEVCATTLKSIDWADLRQKVDAERPKHLPAPTDLYAELDVLGLEGVRISAKACSDALREIDMKVSLADEFDSELYQALQASFDSAREDFIREVRRVLGIKAT